MVLHPFRELPRSDRYSNEVLLTRRNDATRPNHKVASLDRLVQTFNDLGGAQNVSGVLGALERIVPDLARRNQEQIGEIEVAH